jgi:uncharacterized protein YigE (DUF2233 family)
MSSFSPPTPLGLVKVDGAEISSPHKSWLETGMFCTDWRQVKIGPWGQLRNEPFKDCIQSGPLLIEKGVVRKWDDVGTGEDKLVSSVQERGFICVDSTNKVKLGVSDPIRLDEFSHFLFDKLNCRDALNLSGHFTAGLLIGSKLRRGSNDAPLPNVIAVFEK